ncbi:hypothetical protein [Nocardia sp. NRRL S-836]|uniref:hypothetical protein n=1 Tax=Nocardia sp. NRRL S-836 TaxID=1519492 RepID=UPI0006AEA6AC|nr:hypothetical protein [Nocardia sp. NRRL S-836]
MTCGWRRRAREVRDRTLTSATGTSTQPCLVVETRHDVVGMVALHVVPGHAVRQPGEPRLPAEL